MLQPDDVLSLQRRHPQFYQVFDRLYDNYRVTVCSSLFRFNLSQLMSIIVNKLGEGAIGRFSNFTDGHVFNGVDTSTAKTFSNLDIFDRLDDRVVFDLASPEFRRLCDVTSYSYDELRDALEEKERRDAEFRQIILDAIQRQRRGFTANLVIDVATTFFGRVIGSVVERVVDFFFFRRR